MLLLSTHYGNDTMITLYFIFKIIHVISGTAVFSSAFIAPLYWLFEKESPELLYRKTLKIGFLITLPFLLLQLITGFIIIGIKQYSIHLPWVWGVFSGFLMFSLSWLLSLYYLTQKNKIAWLIALIVSFIALLVMLFLMANR